MWLPVLLPPLNDNGDDDVLLLLLAVAVPVPVDVCGDGGSAVVAGSWITTVGVVLVRLRGVDADVPFSVAFSGDDCGAGAERGRGTRPLFLWLSRMTMGRERASPTQVREATSQRRTATAKCSFFWCDE